MRFIDAARLARGVPTRVGATLLVLASLVTPVAQAQPLGEPELQALRFLNATQGQRASVRSACVGGGIAGAGGAAGAIAGLASASGPAAVLVVVGGIAAVGGGAYACSSAFDNARYPLTDAWYQLTTVEARKQALRHIAADGLINVFIANLPQLLRDPLPITEGGPTMKDFAEDLQRGFLLCMQDADPNRSATCARVVGDITPAASVLRENLARNHMLSRCIDREMQTAPSQQRTLMEVLAGCRIVVEEAARANTLPRIAVNQKDIPPPPPVLPSGTPLVIAGMGTTTSAPLDALVLVSASGGNALTFAQILDGKTNLVPLGVGINRVTFQGRPVTIALADDPWTHQFTGGFIEIGGVRFEFVIKRDANGAPKLDEDQNLVFVVTTPGGQRFEGSAGGSSGKPFRLKPLRYSDFDVPVLGRLQFVALESGATRLSGGGFAVEIPAGVTTFEVNGLVARVERGPDGRTTTFSLYTPNGIESYPVGPNGQIATTTGANGAQILRGTLRTPGGEVLSITQELQPDGKSTRTERDSAGRLVRTVRTDSVSGYSEEIRDGVTIVRDRTRGIVRTSQRDADTGVVVNCGAYGPDGNAHYCSDGDTNWNPNDGWGGANPFDAGRTTICLGPRASCPIGLDEWLANPFLGVAGDSAIVPRPVLTFDHCWRTFVAGKSLAEVRATVGAARNPTSGITEAQDCARMVSGIEGLPDAFDGGRRGRTLSTWGILVADNAEPASVPTVPDPTDPTRQLPVGCLARLADRELLIGVERWASNSEIVIDPVSVACLTYVDPFRIDFLVPSGLPDRKYRLTLRDTRTGATITDNLAFHLRREPQTTAVDALTYTVPVADGRYVSLFGDIGTEQTVTSQDLSQCETQMAGKQVWLATYGTAWAQTMLIPRLCVTAVTPGQVNFRLPGGLATGRYVAYVLDATRVELPASSPLVPAIEDGVRSLPFEVIGQGEEALAPRRSAIWRRVE